jgi:hypothetical protein
MNISKSPVFAQLVLDTPNKWIAHCEACHLDLSEPVINREELADVITEHHQTHND